MDGYAGTDLQGEVGVEESVFVDDASTAEASNEYVGRWNRLISTTNWEKGRIITEWREHLIASGAPAQSYSDEAWSRRVGNVSGQHAGRLRRVWGRFGKQREEYQGLYWSHFQAALDWDDAEMYLQGAVESGWSVAQMRAQQWEATGAAADRRPREEEIVAAEFDEDVDLPDDSADEVINGSAAVVRDPQGLDPATAGRGESVDAVPFDNPASPDAEAAVAKPVRPFENLAELPGDLREAFEAFKLAIIGHRLSGWEEISRDEVLATLDALKQLALAPTDS
jgi:hypothetical protein